MARSNVYTLLPLDQFCDIMGFERWQFNQVKEGLTFAREAQCQTVVYQKSWQRVFFSIDEIALAIRNAEEALAPILNYYPAPKYIVNDDIDYPRDYRLETPDWITPRGQWKAVQTAWQHICTLGTLTRTVIEANAVYTTSDDDNDGVDDHFSVTVTTTETDVSKLALYFSSGDREVLDETWRIRPLLVTANGTTATFKGHLSLLVDPALKENPNPSPLDATGAIFVTTVDAYVVSYDTDLIGTAYWDKNYQWNLATTGSINPATPIIRPKDGWIRPIIDGVYTVGRAPDRISINYLAGVPYDTTGRMQEPYASAVAGLAVSYLPSGSCGCERADQKVNFLAGSPADGEQRRRPLSLKEIDNNPFPPTRGGLQAWRLCLERQHPASVRS